MAEELFTDPNRATVYDEAFTSTNGSPWPGFTLNTLSGSDGLIDQQNGDGRLRLNSAGGYDNRVVVYRTMDAVTDGTFYGAFVVPPAKPDVLVSFAVRGSGPQPTWQESPTVCYSVQVRPAAGTALFRRQAGQAAADYTDLGRDNAFACAAGDVIRIAVQTAGNVVRAKLWRNGEMEPTAWKWEFADPSPLPAGVDVIGVRGETNYNSGDVLFQYLRRAAATAPLTGRRRFSVRQGRAKVRLRPERPFNPTPAIDKLTATPGVGEVRVDWTLMAFRGPASGFRLSRDGTDAGGTGPWSTTLPATARTFTFTSLVNGSPYQLTVEPLTATGSGELRTVASTPTATVTSRLEAPAAPTAPSTDTHMTGTWTSIFEDDFTDYAATSSKWNMNRTSYAPKTGWWAQDRAGMPVPPTTDAIEMTNDATHGSAIWLKATRRENPTGKPFVNGLMSTGRPESAQSSTPKFTLPKNSTCFVEAEIWAGRAVGSLLGFSLLANTEPGDGIDVFGNAVTGKGPGGEAVWRQTTAGWPTGGQVDVLSLVENLTGERHRPHSSLHWAKDDNPGLVPPYPGTWGSREFMAHPGSGVLRPELQNSWHKWGMYRSPTLMVTYIDGVELCRWEKGLSYERWPGSGLQTPANVLFELDMHLILTYSIGGGWAGVDANYNPLLDSAIEEGRAGFRYVKVWQKTA